MVCLATLALISQSYTGLGGNWDADRLTGAGPQTYSFNPAHGALATVSREP